MTNEFESRIAKLYLDKYLNSRNEDAFHGLRELGGDCISEIVSRFPNQNSESKILLFEIAREIRDARSTDFLIQCAKESDLPVWQAALEALAYQAPSDLEPILENLLEEAISQDSEEKSAYIKELLSTI